MTGGRTVGHKNKETGVMKTLGQQITDTEGQQEGKMMTIERVPTSTIQVGTDRQTLH